MRVLLALTSASVGAQDTAAARLRFDFGGAIALVSALEQPGLTDSDVATLLRVHGVRAMVDNITRFIPGVGVDQFPAHVKSFARNKRGGRQDGAFQLTGVWKNREEIRATIRQIRSREQATIGQALAIANRYPLNTGPLDITVYFVAGGVSDGFVFDASPEAAFYINLARAKGDLGGMTAGGDARGGRCQLRDRSDS